MAEPFLSEIRIMSFGFAPKGWALCNGQLLPINQNQALFSLLGTTYGGNGQTNFALPDSRGRVPISFGNGHTIGEAAGSTAVTLLNAQMPQHIHFASGVNTSTNNTAISAGNYLANTAPADFYNSVTSGLVVMNPTSISNAGGSQPHLNMQPYTTLNFCIALQGIFPSQT
ncbi:microcystin-dependent protein [Arcicella aurantiaca]|uniref:Microcystin-dependent protein n=1 Tax=Arcicella aurantiaca TaxID=591202 RepID=A0A316EJN7_9BACT|nr:tail fiber protein [Arcicella aurantiaca]PWK29069.1 microcystin-dependent protein [Arcicella aurantiaca]